MAGSPGWREGYQKRQRQTAIVMLPDVHAIRESMGLSQSAFAVMLGVSPRTLKDWEQGRRKPSGPALSLLKVAAKRPDAIREAIAV